MDKFSSFVAGPDGPYSHAVALTPALGEVPPTTAIFVNAQGLLTFKLADDSAAIALYFDYAARGLFKFRVKQVISFTLGVGGPDQFANTDIPAVVGLY